MSACIIKGDKLVWAKAYGYSNVRLKKKATPDTIYLISSVTKTILATAFLQLYEQGKFDLDDDVNEYLSFKLIDPYFPYEDNPITFRKLLSHRAGVYDYCFFNPIGVLTGLVDVPLFPDDLSEWLEERLSSNGERYSKNYWMRYNPPGGFSYYSNIGFLVLSCLFETIANESVEDYCQRNIFDPLEMHNTSFHFTNLDKTKLATLYHRRIAGVYIPLPEYDYKTFAPMCGIRTTVKDLSHFLIAHMNNGIYKNKQILKKETMEIMHNTIYTTKPKMISQIGSRSRKYGLGWWSQDLFDKRVEGHGGFSPGAYCFMLTNTSKNIGVIIQTNKFTITEFYNIIKYKYTWLIGSLICYSLFKKAEKL